MLETARKYVGNTIDNSIDTIDDFTIEMQSLIISYHDS